MGCVQFGPYADFEVNDNICGQGDEAMQVFRLLNISEVEINTLFGYFKKFEVITDPGFSSIEGIMRECELKNEHLVRLMFRIRDFQSAERVTPSHTRLDFLEFVIGLWAFLTFVTFTMVVSLFRTV